MAGRTTRNGALTSVPFFEAYQGTLDKSAPGPPAAPRVESYHGLIFATWDPAAEPLARLPGPHDLGAGLDSSARTAAVEVVGPPMRWRARRNWKLAAANFVGDGHHVPVTHGFATALGLEPRRDQHYAIQTGRGKIFTLPAPHGHAAHLKFAAAEPAPHQYLGLPEDLWPEIACRLPEEQDAALRTLMTAGGNLFPNLSFLHFLNTAESLVAASADGNATSRAVAFLTLRLWQPRGPDQMEAWSWLFVDRGAPAWWREASRTCYLRGFGTAGLFEQDDAENWAEVSRGLRGATAQRLWLQYRMGMASTPSADWPGPGEAYLAGYMELNEREFYRYWRDLMTRD